jgi:hypothetical protein
MFRLILAQHELIDREVMEMLTSVCDELSPKNSRQKAPVDVEMVQSSSMTRRHVGA